MQAEAEKIGDRIDSVPGQWPAVMIYTEYQFVGQVLDGREVVVGSAHPGPQVGVGASRILRRAISLCAVRGEPMM